MHLGAADRDLPKIEVYAEIADADDAGLRGLVHRPRGPESDPNPRQEFARCDGLRDVVVRSFVERTYLVFLLTSGGDDDDRDRALLANPARDLSPVQIGKT